MAPTQARQIRVFISSTFRDMQAERDYLVKFIFPQLRKICEQRAVTWGEVDLRWGITDEQSAEGQVLPLCLAEISRCRPYFIGLLGERYGWIPDAIDPDLVAREPWLQQHLQHSVTELEILHGVLNDPEMSDHALFYFRDPDYTQSISAYHSRDFIELPIPEEISEFGEEEAQKRAETRRNKLTSLKERIRQSGMPLKENYGSPKELGEWVLADLTAVIEKLFPEGSEPSELQKEAEQHEAYARSRAQIYIGGEKYFSHIDEHMRESNLPLVVTGESGSGKSALLANWALDYRDKHPGELVLMHFIGASPASANRSAMLRRIITELKKGFEIGVEIPTDDQELSTSFANLLYMAAAKGRFTLVLDALNQLEDRQGARELLWLPNELPDKMRLIMSTLPGISQKAAVERGWPMLEVQPLEIDERLQLLRSFLLERFSKRLSSEQELRIIHDPQSANPMGLRLLLDELRQFGSREQLDERIDAYLRADSISALFDLVLQRCEQDYENECPGLLREALSLLWAARHGLSEKELLDMLGSEGLPLPQRIWAPLGLALESSFTDQAGLLNFFHDFIRQAVELRYLPGDEERDKGHRKISEYFASMKDFLSRKLEELPWQLHQARDWQYLYELLCDLPFLEALYEKDKQEVFIYWAAIEANSHFKRTTLIRDLDRVQLKPNQLKMLGTLLQNAGFLHEAMSIFRQQQHLCNTNNDFAGLQSALGNQAIIMGYWGETEKSMDMLRSQESICRQHSYQDSLQSCLGSQALIQKDKGRLEEAMKLLKEKEEICQHTNNQRGLQESYGSQALILRTWGKLEEASILHKKEEELSIQLGNFEGLQSSLGSQALILRDLGKLSEAMQLLKKKEKICQILGNLEGYQRSIGSQALVLRDSGDLIGALKLHQIEETICRDHDFQDSLQSSLGCQALIQKELGNLKRAITLHIEEEKICRSMNNQEGLQRSLGNQALILIEWGKLDDAMKLLIEQESICRSMNHVEGLCKSTFYKGILFGKMGDSKKQSSLLTESLEIARQHHLLLLVAQIQTFLKM